MYYTNEEECQRLIVDASKLKLYQTVQLSDSYARVNSNNLNVPIESTQWHQTILEKIHSCGEAICESKSDRNIFTVSDSPVWMGQSQIINVESIQEAYVPYTLNYDHLLQSKIPDFYEERHPSNYKLMNLFGFSTFAGLTSIVQESVSTLEQFFYGFDTNIKKLAYKLVNSSWKVKSHYFCLRLLLLSQTSKIKLTCSTIDYATDSKADSKHHCHGVRLPPPIVNLYAFHLTTGCPPCLVEIRGENLDMNSTNLSQISIKGGVIWIPFKSKFKPVSKHGIKHNQLLEKEPHICIRSYAKLSKRIQSLQEKLVSSCSKSTNFCLRKTTSKPLATCPFSRCQSLQKNITKNHHYAKYRYFFS